MMEKTETIRNITLVLPRAHIEFLWVKWYKPHFIRVHIFFSNLMRFFKKRFKREPWKFRGREVKWRKNLLHVQEKQAESLVFSLKIYVKLDSVYCAAFRLDLIEMVICKWISTWILFKNPNANEYNYSKIYLQMNPVALFIYCVITAILPTLFSVFLNH